MGGCQRPGAGSWVFHGDRVSVGEDENVLEGDGSDDCTTARMYLMSPKCALKNGYDGTFRGDLFLTIVKKNGNDDNDNNKVLLKQIHAHSFTLQGKG